MSRRANAGTGRLAGLALAMLVGGCGLVTSGQETCLGCRMDRDASVHFGLKTSGSARRNDFSVRVNELVPEHEHRWAASGCWWTGTTFARLASPAVLGIPRDLWLAYLEKQPAEQRAAALAALIESGGREIQLERWEQRRARPLDDAR